MLSAEHPGGDDDYEEQYNMIRMINVGVLCEELSRCWSGLLLSRVVSGDHAAGAPAGAGGAASR